MIDFDNKFRNKNIKLIAGIDEAGRGPLAGPVVAAAVIFEPNVNIKGINDSKKLTAIQREKLFPEIIEKSLSFSVEVIEHNIIDEINILQASLLAMKNSVEKLNIKPDLLLIDGNKKFKSNIETQAIVKGDSKSFSIAAASIIAKVTRDRIMKNLAEEFPVYGWEKNMGYPTKFHIEAVKKFGASDYHRKSFLKKILINNGIE